MKGDRLVIAVCVNEVLVRGYWFNATAIFGARKIGKYLNSLLCDLAPPKKIYFIFVNSQ